MSKLELGTKVRVKGSSTHHIKDGAECVVSHHPIIAELSKGLDATIVEGEIHDDMQKEYGLKTMLQLVPNDQLEVI
tara:strand:- start:49819 stop:50046 length:228 start_codon:yes stop_codon:yes gene_type:complete